jgi:hypothetical protein
MSYKNLLHCNVSRIILMHMDALTSLELMYVTKIQSQSRYQKVLTNIAQVFLLSCIVIRFRTFKRKSCVKSY